MRTAFAGLLGGELDRDRRRFRPRRSRSRRPRTERQADIAVNLPRASTTVSHSSTDRRIRWILRRVVAGSVRAPTFDRRRRCRTRKLRNSAASGPCPLASPRQDEGINPKGTRCSSRPADWGGSRSATSFGPSRTAAPPHPDRPHGRAREHPGARPLPAPVPGPASSAIRLRGSRPGRDEISAACGRRAEPIPTASDDQPHCGELIIGWERCDAGAVVAAVVHLVDRVEGHCGPSCGEETRHDGEVLTAADRGGVPDA